MLKSRSLEELIDKIDAFIKTYYKSRILRGAIYAVGLMLIFFLLLNLLEYFSYFGSTTRAILFFGYIISTLVLLAVYVINPLLKLFRIGNRITYEQAATIISKHFPEISDRLVNTLQLGSMASLGNVNLEILEAAIRQKTEKIKHIPFSRAIDNKENIRKTPIALIPLSIILLLLVTAPTLIKEPSQRITNFRVHYERPMPFTFEIDLTNLKAFTGDDLDLIVRLSGSEFPAEIFVEYNGKSARCARLNNNEFIYKFRNLTEDVRFRVQGGNFFSDTYLIKVLPKPIILNYEVELNYPAYIQRTKEVLQNTGDLTVPIGTEIKWSFITSNTDSVVIRTNIDRKPEKQSASNNNYIASIRALEAFDYTIIPINKFTNTADSLLHRAKIIPDLYPEISIEVFFDSINLSMAYFTGQIKDDYGFDKLEYHFRRRNVRSVENILDQEKRLIPIDKTLNQQTFFFSFNLSEINIEPGDRLEYWFEVWDNDRINGSKSTRTSIGLIEIPGLREQEQMIAGKQEEMLYQMSYLQKELSDLLRNIDQFQKSILQKESISWEDTNKLQEMLERQQLLQDQIEQLKEDNLALNRMQENLGLNNEEILQKQQELQALFDELMTDEMRQLFEEIQKLLDELDRNKMQEILNQMKMSNEDLLKNLDRNLELFKQLEMEKLITDAIAKLQQLAEEQEKLAEETDDPSSSTEELMQKQEEIESEFEKIKEDLEKISEKNEELELKYDMIDTDEAEKGIENSMNKSIEELQKNQKPKAAPHQRDAAKQMQMLGENLMDMMMQMQSEQLAEDIRMLRKLLEDLIDLSFDQEDLIDRTVSTNRIDPRFNELLSEQQRIIVGLKQVEDSLNALAKRQLAIQQFVIREISQINLNAEEAIKTLEDRNISSAASRQQFVMTSVNNLALMLSEAMEQMMQQLMSSSMDGDSCPSSGQGMGKSKPGMSTMKDLQQELNRQLEEMRQSMGSPGENGMPQQGGQSMSEQFARMAAQQEALRRQMQQYLEELRSETGKSDGNLVNAIEEMEQTEKDLVNRRLTNETFLRQERILTRLLESERAEMEREKDERRESRSAQNYPTSDPDSVMELYRRKMMEREMLRTVPAQMNYFYRARVNDYFIQVQ